MGGCCLTVLLGTNYADPTGAGNALCLMAYLPKDHNIIGAAWRHELGSVFSAVKRVQQCL